MAGARRPPRSIRRSPREHSSHSNCHTVRSNCPSRNRPCTDRSNPRVNSRRACSNTGCPSRRTTDRKSRCHIRSPRSCSSRFPSDSRSPCPFHHPNPVRSSRSCSPCFHRNRNARSCSSTDRCRPCRNSSAGNTSLRWPDRNNRSLPVATSAVRRQHQCLQYQRQCWPWRRVVLPMA